MSTPETPSDSDPRAYAALGGLGGGASGPPVRAGPEREAVLDFHGKLGRPLVGAGPRLTGGLLDG